VNYAQKVALKLAATLLASAIAFCLGAFTTGTIVQHWLISGRLQRSYTDPLGAQMLTRVLQGGFAAAFVVFLIGIIWTVMTSRQQEEAAAESQAEPQAEPQRVI
jgi:TRAP-type C4-dicarboxylate transport system permease small subunit